MNKSFFEKNLESLEMFSKGQCDLKDSEVRECLLEVIGFSPSHLIIGDRAVSKTDLQTDIRWFLNAIRGLPNE